MLVPGDIFRSRYRVEGALGGGALHQGYALRDVLGGQRALLYLYGGAAPAGRGRAERVPLDLDSFAYRLARAETLCPGRVPPCQLGEQDDAIFALVELDDGAAPLSPPLAEAELHQLAATLLGDVCACRVAGLRLHGLAPGELWRRQDGTLLLLPPVVFPFPGFLDLGAPGSDPSPSLACSHEQLQDADLHGLARVLERFTAGKPAWRRFREELLPRFQDGDLARRPGPAALLAATPLADDETLASHCAAAESSHGRLRLDPALAERCEGMLRDFRAGENLWVELEGDGAAHALRALALHLAQSGESAWEIEGLDRPGLLLDPRWAPPGGDGQVLALASAAGLAASPALRRHAEGAVDEWQRLRRLTLAVPALSSPPASAAPPPEVQPLLELLALQDEPVAVGLLARLVGGGGGAGDGQRHCFAWLGELDARGLLRWRPGLDDASGRWGLRVELADAERRRALREALDPDRRRELHRLCTALFPGPERGGLPRAGGARALLLRLGHLRGAGDWSTFAVEAMGLFRWAEREGHPLLLAQLAEWLCAPSVESRLGVDGLRRVHLYLGQDALRRADLDGAAQRFTAALQALTGVADFPAALLDETRPRVELAGGAAGLLPAVSLFLRHLAEIGETRGEFAWAIALLGRLLDSYSEELSGHERGLLLNELAWLHYRKGEHRRAVERCEVALRLFDPAAHHAELGQTYNTLGAAQWALNRWAEAEAFYKRALALRERAGDENRVAASLNNLGNLYRHTDRFALAIDYFNRSMAIKKRLKNYPGYLASLYNVALINFELADLQAARAQCQECLELNRLVGNIQLGAEVQGLLGEIDEVEGRPAEAKANLEAAIATCREIQAHTELVTMFRRLVPVQIALGELEAARETVAEGLEGAERTRNRLESARIRATSADVHLALGDRPQALAALEAAADLYAELDRSEELARGYSRIGLLVLEDGDEARARDCLQRATEIIERRRVGAIIAEWDTLQLRLQQRLGQFVDRIEGDGRLRLAGLYQCLALLEGAADPREGIEQVLRLLRESLGYQRARLCLAPAPGGDLPRWLGGEEAGPEEAGQGAPWRRRSYEEQVLGGGARLLLQPLVGPSPGLDDGAAGLLVLERGGEPAGPAERDFLTGLGRLLRLALPGDPARAPRGKGHARPRSRTGSREGPRLVGRGRDMQRLHQLIERVRDVDTTVLITGESGTGKEEVARAIHFSSARREQPFLPVNCASIPSTLLESTLFGHERGAFTSAVQRHIGVFEEAAGGTVFLDEIGELTADMQAKLLRVLQSMEFTRVGGTQVLKADVRVLTATNRDLEAEVRHGQFREDLFYRINVLRLHLAPLREKREDIPLLVEHFLTQAGTGHAQGAKRLSQEVRDVLQQHPWPGNVRQLRNVIHACVVMARGAVIQLEDLPDDFLNTRHDSPSRQSLDALADLVVTSGDFSEEQPLEEALLAALAHRLVEALGSKAKAARMLGISKPTLYRRLRSYDTLEGRRGTSP